MPLQLFVGSWAESDFDFSFLMNFEGHFEKFWTNKPSCSSEGIHLCQESISTVSLLKSTRGFLLDTGVSKLECNPKIHLFCQYSVRRMMMVVGLKGGGSFEGHMQKKKKEGKPQLLLSKLTFEYSSVLVQKCSSSTVASQHQEVVANVEHGGLLFSPFYSSLQGFF